MLSWNNYDAIRFLKTPPADLRHAELVKLLKELRALNPSSMRLEEIGKSYEGRSISSVTLGTGPTRILAWSQMHGNEPTHTAALLDLINMLQTQPESTISRSILSGCTLTLVPILNPDGAERYTRRNAQDLDVNRDALHFESPEGRILRQLVNDVKPQFAFNLHNQQARTSVDGRKVAAVSLLVPPIDQPDTQTAWTQRAKQVAAVFFNAVRPHCEGMISRYDADFMPRCFGEWFQQQEIATLTVEAGGWSTIDSGPLVQVHTMGLVNMIESIADGSYAEFNAAEYDQLPRSSEHYLFDVVIRKVEVVRDGGAPFKADLGINFTRVQDRVPVEGGGRIEDLGDLCVTSGKEEISGEGLVCVPGGIVYAPEFTPLRMPTIDDAKKFLQSGFTTVIGVADSLMSEAEAARISKSLPINIGFVARSHQSPQLERCAIKLGAAADLVFYAREKVQMVMLGGQVVFENDQLKVTDGGELVRGKGFFPQ